MRNYSIQGYSTINPDTAKDLIKINEEVEKEKANPEPDRQKIAKLMYRQLLTGLQTNGMTGRNYNV